MKKETAFIIALGALAFAAAWHFQRRAPEASRTAPPPPVTPKTSRQRSLP